MYAAFSEQWDHREENSGRRQGITQCRVPAGDGNAEAVGNRFQAIVLLFRMDEAGEQYCIQSWIVEADACRFLLQFKKTLIESQVVANNDRVFDEMMTARQNFFDDRHATQHFL